MNAPQATDQYSAVAAFEEWNEVTGVLPKGTGYYYECQSLFEDADAEIERLKRENAEFRAQLDALDPRKKHPDVGDGK